VRFLGHRENAADLMSGLDVLVNTSRYEGQPLSILEAMLRGIPVCAPDIAGMEEMIGDDAGGRVIAPEDGDVLGAVLLEMLADPRKLANMGVVARERARLLYSVEAMCRATADAYRRCVGTRNTPAQVTRPRTSMPTASGLSAMAWRNSSTARKRMSAGGTMSTASTGSVSRSSRVAVARCDCWTKLKGRASNGNAGAPVVAATGGMFGSGRIRRSADASRQCLREA
jgi:hypothetical protein